MRGGLSKNAALRNRAPDSRHLIHLKDAGGEGPLLWWPQNPEGEKP
jgi:hypothetical protein